MTTNASRAPVDFDAFARDLQQPQPTPLQGAAEAHGAVKADPLAELARIIGQDDPFRAILAARDPRADAVSSQRVEPRFVDAPPVQPAAAYRPAAASPTDAFDQYLASVEQAPYPIQGAEAPQAEQDAFETGDRTPLGRPRQRSRLVSVGAGLGVVAVCITAGLAWRGLHSGGGSSNGGVPTILADTAPLKVAPQKADGVEIPDQNKQIYDRTAKDGQIRIVNREEQPLDVAQAARSAQGTTQGAGEGGATPGNAGASQTGTLTESLGEPRRVRTVSVKPETPPLPPQPEAAEPPPASVIPTMTLPGTATDGATAPASLRPRGARVSAPLTTPTATPVAEAPAPAPAAPAPAPRAKAPQRVAAVAPETTAAVVPPPATAAESPAPAAGSFAVQLGVRGSASEAQAAFREMQGKYAALAGKPALIRQAEVNGKSLYRVRVGPLGKNEATSLCSQLQAAGGQCFVAKN